MVELGIDFGAIIQAAMAGAFLYFGKQVTEVSKLIALHDYRLNQLEAGAYHRRATDKKVS